MHGVFDIVGPIMIGPSSSHTAGAVRLGLMARNVLGEEQRRVDIGLAGSFAETYHGHGTDKAIMAGILGFRQDDERIRDALVIADRMGIEYHFEPVKLINAHPNTAIIFVTGVTGRTARIKGASVGGGNIFISEINGYEVELTGMYPALITVHRDRPGIITNVTHILAGYEVNVAFMRVSRGERGETAMMILELDAMPSDEVVEECREVKYVEHAFSIPAVG